MGINKARAEWLRLLQKGDKVAILVDEKLAGIFEVVRTTPTKVETTGPTDWNRKLDKRWGEIGLYRLWQMVPVQPEHEAEMRRREFANRLHEYEMQHRLMDMPMEQLIRVAAAMGMQEVKP